MASEEATTEELALSKLWKCPKCTALFSKIDTAEHLEFMLGCDTDLLFRDTQKPWPPPRAKTFNRIRKRVAARIAAFVEAGNHAAEHLPSLETIERALEARRK